MNHKKKPIILSLEGNIGSGKSTLLRTLKRHFKEKGLTIEYMEEPVDVWNTFRDAGDGETILQKYYKDSGKYAFTFQMITIMTRVKILDEIISREPDIIIMERSPYSDKEIFVKLARKYGYMNDIEFQTYDFYYNQYNKEHTLDGIIYLDTTPALCHEHIKRRKREGESDISPKYLYSIDEYHTQLYRGFDGAKLTITIEELYNDDLGLPKIDDFLCYVVATKFAIANSVDI